MEIFIVLIIVVILLWFVGGYFKFRMMSRGMKIAVRMHLVTGLPLSEAIKKAFLELNQSRKLGLQDATIEKVSNKIASFEEMMNTDNVMDIYSTFVWRYIFRDGGRMKPKNLTDEKVIYALENLKFNEKNGFYVIKPDKGAEIDEKYPS